MDKYTLYEMLLIINAAAGILTKNIFFWPVNAAGMVMLLGGVALDLYWELFWAKHHSDDKPMVTVGPYSYVRHPLLAAFLLISFGMSAAFSSVPSFVIAMTTCIIFIIGAKKEEQLLIRRYGREYEGYKEKVRYRFVPYLF